MLRRVDEELINLIVVYSVTINKHLRIFRSESEVT